MAVCYRHPDRETGVSCSSCGRPICPDCMTPTSVGMRCPECARERTQVRTIRNLGGDPIVTYALIAINVIVFIVASVGGGGLANGGGEVIARGGLFGPAIAQGHEYWRLVTSGFLHEGILHLGFNMLLVWFLGRSLEYALGRWQFLAVYVVGLLSGAAGALLVSPNALTVGASGAGFGLMGAALVVGRARGFGFDQQILVLIGLNLLFSLRPGISIGGHIGGLIGGVVAALVITQLGEQRGARLGALATCVLLAAGFAALAIAVA